MGKYSPFNRTEASALAPVTREHPSMSPSLQKKRRRTQDQKAELFEDQLNQSTSSFPPGVRPKDSINITHQAGPIASTPKASHSSISTVSKGAPAHVAISSPITPTACQSPSPGLSPVPDPGTPLLSLRATPWNAILLLLEFNNCPKLITMTPMMLIHPVRM